MSEGSLDEDVAPLQPRSGTQRITYDSRENSPEAHIPCQQLATNNPSSREQATSISLSSHGDDSAVDSRPDLPSTPLPPYYHFNRLLLEISENIPNETLEKIKFVYKDELKSKLNSKIENARELFRILEQRRYIVPESMINLQSIVMMIEDEDTKKQLMTRIFQHSVEHKAVYFRRSTDEPPNGYRRFQCHIKGVEHFNFDTERVKNLLYTVASITGTDLSQILVDGIEMTKSIYISFLVKDVHYIIFYELIRRGIPLMSDMNVDIVTFYNVEENEGETVIDVLSGRKTYLNLPPIRESPEETIQKLKRIIEEVQIQNMDYERKIKELSDKSQRMSAEVKGDLKVMSKGVHKAIKDALEEGVSEHTLHRIIALNTELIEGLEKKKYVATENKLRSELECMEVELDGYKNKLQVFLGKIIKEEDKTELKLPKSDKEFTLSDQKKIEEIRNSDLKAETDISNDKEEQILLDSLKDSLKTAERLGYSKTIVEQLVVRNTLYTEYKCRKTSDIEKKSLKWQCRLLKEMLSVTDSLLQQTANSFGFKQDLMVQLETVFESKGDVIPKNKGYKEDLLKFVMDLSSRISYEEEQQLIRGFQDNKLTVIVKRDRRFLLLRLFYLENLNCESLILLENFVCQRLFDIQREDLENIWRTRVASRDPALQLHDLLLQTLADGVLRGAGIPGLDDLFTQITLKLSVREKGLLRKKLPQEDDCHDHHLLQKLLQHNQSKGQKNQDDLLLFVKHVLEEIGRNDLFAEFEIKFFRLIRGIKPEVRDILRITSSKISKNKRKKLKSRLEEQRFIDEDEILLCLTLEHFEPQVPIGIDEFDSFIKKTLSDIDQKLVEDFENLMKERGLKGDRVLTTQTNVQFQFHGATGDSNKLILEKLAEMSNEIKSIKEKQMGFQSSPDIFGQSSESWAKGLADERFLSRFFTESVRAGGFDKGKSMSGSGLPEMYQSDRP